jgi:hypothetical protein
MTEMLWCGSLKWTLVVGQGRYEVNIYVKHLGQARLFYDVIL